MGIRTWEYDLVLTQLLQIFSEITWENQCRTVSFVAVDWAIDWFSDLKARRFKRAIGFDGSPMRLV